MGEAEKEAFAHLESGDRLWLMGTLLYWAEGAKAKAWTSGRRVSFTNMDPAMIRIILAWLRQCCAVGAADIEFALYIHPNGNVQMAQAFWARELGVNGNMRTYFKRPNYHPRRKNIGQSYYGTMRVGVRQSTSLLYRIEGWRRGIIAHCGVV